MQGVSYKTFQGKKRIGVEDGKLKLRKALRSYRDYGNTFYEVWSESSINYIFILVSLFGAIAPWLQAALPQFYGAVLQLSKIYKWRQVLLSFVIEVYSHIVSPPIQSNGYPTGTLREVLYSQGRNWHDLVIGGRQAEALQISAISPGQQTIGGGRRLNKQPVSHLQSLQQRVVQLGWV